jgi:thiol-disulfide isomerase/thioredoxin
MNKSTLAIVGVGVLLLFGGVFVVATSDNDTATETNSSEVADRSEQSPLPQTVDSQIETPAPEAAVQSYVTTTGDELASITGDKRVLFFHASWCPTCKSLDKEISSTVSEIPAGTTIARLDFDKETDLRKKYGVTVQHTLVQIDAEGNEVAKWSGSRDLASLLAKVQ